jgi:hypothetical protein
VPINNGSPGAVPTRYAGEIVLPKNPEAADVRIAVRQAESANQEQRI